jgi:hypothetical protein
MDDETISDIVKMVLIIGSMGFLAYLAYQFLTLLASLLHLGAELEQT